MATLTTQTITRAGLAATLAAASGGGDKFTPTGRTFLEVNNGSGGAITVTVETPTSVGANLVTTPLAVSVAAGARTRIGPFPGGLFADPADGLTDVTYSGVTSLTIAAIELPV